MLSEGKQKKLRKPDFVKFRHEDYVIVIARQKRFPWMEHTESQYVYYMYITRSQKRFISDTTAQVAEFNILCFCHIYSSFQHLMKVIEPILSEYILDSKKIIEIVMLCEELNE
ncbi:hypothetical protein [Anoxybacillus gonensis]|uniref:hypothetical protein n=1 Tax=Anoxybacillus gonensis TaxID=198467 RepID=UPI0002BE965A|nr:hypothetical protein [Anoxybacillus gonensis]EMI11395.1 hypothetical protein F510_0572 [Anoxybacillus gonensis]